MTGERPIRLVDATLRDGSHAIRHRFTPEQVTRIASRLDEAGVYAVGVGHGDGVGGSSYQYGFALHPDEELHAAAAAAVSRAKLAVTMIPGIGTKEHLHRARDFGCSLARIATHCTEADIAEQHIALARELGFEVHGDLMMSHMQTPEGMGEQARIMVDAGAQGVYIMDSAGALTVGDVRARVAAMLAAIGDIAEVGMHAHNNLSLAVANSVAAIEEGATLVDACLAGLGAGAGNCQTEVLVAVLERLGYDTGIDLWTLQDAADSDVRPLMVQPPTIDRDTLTLGYAGVPSSFLLHARRASDALGVDTRDILVELGRRRVVGGQEDVILDVASGLAGASERST